MTSRTDITTISIPGIDLIRNIAAWADFQNEYHWLRQDKSKNATVGQIVELHDICQRFDVDSPDCLDEIDNPEAAAAWKNWRANRGPAQ